tara:strand:- start:858 stop:1034 length:177 start_codon:yes stop_codon:yes gene_type:complete
MRLNQLVHKNDELFNELEFWKSTALEQGASEDAYEECCRDVARMQGEMDWDNTGSIHA